jgi:CSLREA domain-containing protein
MERNRRVCLQILALALTLTIVIVSLQPVKAATITVNTTTDGFNDDENCSLREAIQAANTNAAVDACPAGSSSGTDTITFAAATDGIPIVLAGLAAENANVSGDLDVLDGGDLVIQGNGTDNTIIDGDGIDRVFHICPGGSCDSRVTLSGVTIRNGTVTLSGGGGLRNEGGATILDASAILTSIAINGGGIANFATLNIQNGTHIGEPGAGNWAFGGNGGGIYNYAGTTTIDASSVISNTAFNNGGGIWSQVTLNVQNGSQIGANAADGTDTEDGGGGIYNYAGTTTVDSSDVISNTARRGGGLYTLLDSTTTVNGSSVSSNTAMSGGGIYNNGTTTVDDSTINDNTANQHGGGIFNNDILHVLNGSTIGGAGVPNTANRGGGIFNDHGTTTLSGSNEAQGTEWEQGGGGIYNNETMMATGSIIRDNRTSSDGGGIYLYTASATLDNCTVSGNNSSSNGGGFYVLGSDLSVEASLIISNTASGAGGGIYNEGGTTTLNGSTVRKNTAANGGGIHNDGITTVTGSLLLDNTATTNGGGVYNYGTTTVTGSLLLYNIATSNGGAVFNNMDFEEATSVTGSCIVGNSDIAFYNNQSENQIATGNWWGAAEGPNKSGADTVFGSIDISGFLVEPILDCTTDLQVGKTNDTGGKVTLGSPFHWTLTISNTGLLNASFETGQVILRDNLPAGPSYGTPAVNNLVDITNSANISCTINQNTLTCEALLGGVTIGSVTGSFEVSFSVTSNAPGTLVNPTGICRVDPDDNVDEGDEDNSCPADFVEVAVPNIYLPLVIFDGM